MKRDLNRVVTKEECEKLINPSFDQSKKLFEASKKLFDEEYYPIAYSLYVLSLEELSKALLCIYGASGILEIKRRHLFSHINKQKFLGVVGLTGLLMMWKEMPRKVMESLTNTNLQPLSSEGLPKEIDDSMGQLLGLIVSANHLKEIGFYVDLDDDGEIIIPDQEITKEDFPPKFHRSKQSPTLSLDHLNINMLIYNTLEIESYKKSIFPPEIFETLFPIPADKFLSSLSYSTKVMK